MRDRQGGQAARGGRRFRFRFASCLWAQSRAETGRPRAVFVGSSVSISVSISLSTSSLFSGRSPHISGEHRQQAQRRVSTLPDRFPSQIFYHSITSPATVYSLFFPLTTPVTASRAAASSSLSPAALCLLVFLLWGHQN